MQRSTLVSRAVIAGLVVAGLGASGCSWFTKTDELYALSEQERPLEVPPELDLPNTDAAMGVPGGSVTASETVTAAAQSREAPAPTAADGGFAVEGSRDDVFARVGEALAATEGVEVISRAELLGAYDVNYQGSNFLVRVSEGAGGVQVSAVDPRGLPATGPAPSQLLALLQGALGGN
jgi:uncharacterized lipoprotein